MVQNVLMNEDIQQDILTKMNKILMILIPHAGYATTCSSKLQHAATTEANRTALYICTTYNNSKYNTYNHSKHNTYNNSKYNTYNHSKHNTYNNSKYNTYNHSKHKYKQYILHAGCERHVS